MSSNKSSLMALTVGAIGVVYGDIGTSVLYALKEVFGSGHVAFTPENIYGILSIFFWTLTTIVSVKYVTLVLRADNHGEGGLVAMLALASQSVKDKPQLRKVLLMVGIFGTCLFYGDGVITPAISVLSAVEGLEIVSPAFNKAVIPLTLLILFVLFAVQKRGTTGIGQFFGPITLVWFAAIAVLGLYHIAAHPEILWAISPHYALSFIWNNPGTTFVILGAVVLCVTGGEALYADMGHFGKQPIRLAWFTTVMPALTLNYFGQGALLLSNPEAVKNPFYMMAPEWALIPLVCLATMATVIASQALITGAFSVTKQVIQLGYLPRLQVLHTSVKELGQIYIPFVNWGLFVLIVLAVALFKSSSNLAAAYGIAVCTDMLITTTLRRLLNESMKADSFGLVDFLEAIFVAPPARVEGTAVFLTAEIGSVPNALLHNLKHNKVLHRQNLFVTVRSHEVPWIGLNKRLEIESLHHDCWQVIVNYGFKNDPDLPKALEQLKVHGADLDPMTTSYFLSRDIVIPTIGGGMATWREKLFAQMHLNASAAAEFLKLPNNSVVELGSKIEI
ncbi:MAG: potassium transporter Kup [Betaproteobacteria bacterium]|nr:potassium transporter Kup [Betaproteobacteria bacterium]